MVCRWDHNDWSRKKMASLTSRKDSLQTKSVREHFAALWCSDETPNVIDSDLFLSKWGHNLLVAEIVWRFAERIIKHWVSRLPAYYVRLKLFSRRNKTKISNPIVSTVSLKWHLSQINARLCRAQLSVSRLPWVNFELWSCKLLKLEWD